MRRYGTLALTLCLLFATVAGVAGHDHGAQLGHGAQLDPNGYTCAVDHGRPHGEHRGHGLESAGDGHRHHCLSCRYEANRPLLTTQDVIGDAHRPQASAPVVHPTAGNAAPCISLSLRGPPQATLA